MIIAFGIVVHTTHSIFTYFAPPAFQKYIFRQSQPTKSMQKRSIIPISCHVVAISPIMGWSLFMHKGFGKFLWTIERALKKLQPDYEGMSSFQRGFQGNVNYWSQFSDFKLGIWAKVRLICTFWSSLSFTSSILETLL